MSLVMIGSADEEAIKEMISHANEKAAQEVLLVRASANSQTQQGLYKGGSEDKSTTFVANYCYWKVWSWQLIAIT